MSRSHTMFSLSLAACFFAAVAGGPGAFLQKPRLATQTRPSDIDALSAFWDSIKGPGGGCAPGWGNRSLDPCVGEATDPNNAQGFGQWKGVACVACPSQPQYMCVAQIFLDNKCLRGRIPEDFKGLTELWWVLLSNNNITGPLPVTNWETMPKLVSLDISHNNIEGRLPLDGLKHNGELRYIKAHHNHLDGLDYSGGGFTSLLELKLIYNRNLTAQFPVGLADIPNLQQLEIHDTNISGLVPREPWRKIELMLISGTGGLCGGALPTACSRTGTHCDLIAALPTCGGLAAVPLEPGAAKQTRPSDIDALDRFWQSVSGGTGNAPGWGNRSLDPCIGDATDPHNAQGFGQWKGVACVVCPNEPEYFCVSQIWLDGKSLSGRIPENFTGLTELWWLLLSNNRISGPLPYSNWRSMPKIVSLDVSHNNITGALPMNELSELPRLRYLAAHHNMLDEFCYYHGGGFPSLHSLNIIYNRNMTGTLPPGISTLPELRRLEMHDTHVRGTVPSGSFPSMQLLLISGTGGLCGNTPKACSQPGVHCDLGPGTLPSC